MSFFGKMDPRRPAEQMKRVLSKPGPSVHLPVPAVARLQGIVVL